MQIKYRQGWGFEITSAKKQELDELEQLAKESDGHVHFAYKGRYRQRNGSYAIAFAHTLLKFKRNGTYLTGYKRKKSKHKK